jgi:hypothetical protein
VNGVSYLELRVYHHRQASNEEDEVKGNDVAFVKSVMQKVYEYSRTLTSVSNNCDQWIKFHCADSTLIAFKPMLWARCPSLIESVDSQQTVNILLSRYALDVLLEYILYDKLPHKSLDNRKLDDTDSDVHKVNSEDDDDDIEIADDNDETEKSHEEKVMDILSLYIFNSGFQACSDLMRLQVHLLSCLVENITPSNIVSILLKAKEADAAHTSELFEYVAPYLCEYIRKKTDVEDLQSLRDGENSALFFDIIVKYQNKPTEQHELPNSTFSAALEVMFVSNNKDNTDVMLYLDEEHEEVIHAHKIILGICCPFLKKIFDRERCNTVNLYDVEDFQDHRETMTTEDIQQRRTLLAQLIEYFYTGKYCVTTSNAFTLLSLSSFFGATSELISACEDIVAENLAIDNIFIIINKFACVDHLKMIRERCLSYCATHWKEITSRYSEQELTDSIDSKFWLDLVNMLYKENSLFQ